MPAAEDEDEEADFPIFGSAEPEPVAAQPEPAAAQPSLSVASTNDPSRAASEVAPASTEPGEEGEEEEEEEEEEEDSEDVRTPSLDVDYILTRM